MHYGKALALAMLVGGMLLPSSACLADTLTLGWRDLLPTRSAAGEGAPGAPRHEQVRQDLHEKEVRIPGFIVPIEYDDQYVVTRFLLVPYFGACMHEPPPPPNQTIYAEFEPGYKLESMWLPVWIEGQIRTARVEAALATASYSMSARKIEIYEQR